MLPQFAKEEPTAAPGQVVSSKIQSIIDGGVSKKPVEEERPILLVLSSGSELIVMTRLAPDRLLDAVERADSTGARIRWGDGSSTRAADIAHVGPVPPGYGEDDEPEEIAG
jgi:hypothetical protein